MFQSFIRLASVSGLILTATLGLGGGSTLAAEGTVQKIASTSEGYCHLKIPAARPSTLATDKPQLKSSNTEDVIDFYGPCDYDPVGKDAISTQKKHRSRLHGKL